MLLFITLKFVCAILAREYVCARACVCVLYCGVHPECNRMAVLVRVSRLKLLFGKYHDVLAVFFAYYTFPPSLLPDDIRFFSQHCRSQPSISWPVCCDLFLPTCAQLVIFAVRRSSWKRLTCPVQDHVRSPMTFILSLTHMLECMSLTHILYFMSLYVMFSVDLLRSILVCAAEALVCSRF